MSKLAKLYSIEQTAQLYRTDPDRDDAIKWRTIISIKLHQPGGQGYHCHEFVVDEEMWMQLLGDLAKAARSYDTPQWEDRELIQAEWMAKIRQELLRPRPLLPAGT